MKNCLIQLIVFVSLGVYGQDSVIVFHKKAPMPAFARIEGASFVIDSDFYFVGGVDSFGNLTSEAWKYSARLDTWSPIVSYPGGSMFAAGAFVVNNKAYICCGKDSISNGNINSQIWEYNPVLNSWLRKNDFPGLPEQLPSCFSYNNKGYMGFGYGLSGNQLWQYDAGTDHWIEVDSLVGTKRFGLTPVVIDSFAYFIAGSYEYSYGSLNEVWRYRILGNRWERLADMPGVSGGYAPSWGKGNSLLTGFGLHADSIGFTLLGGSYSYNIQSSSWKPVICQNFLDSTAYGVSFMIGNTGYFFGGDKLFNPWSSYSTDLWYFDASSFLTTGIEEANINMSEWKVYPNPVSSGGIVIISSFDGGNLSFCTSIGQLLYITPIHSGINQISCEQLHTEEGMIFYTATLSSGNTANGKVAIVK